jgi:hypothetical protein
MSRGPLRVPFCFWASASTRTGRPQQALATRTASARFRAVSDPRAACVALGFAGGVADVGNWRGPHRGSGCGWGSLAIPTYAGCRRARACQGAAWKRRRGLTGRVPAGLDRPCARRLRDLAVGTEECSRRGSNQRMDLKQDGEAGGADLRGLRLCSQQTTRPLCRITDCAASYEVVGIPLILSPYSCVTTDHACALSGFAKSGAGGFVLVSAEA